ncbi:MAG: hypothetical protein ACKOAG_12575, partial [Candidatus Kapaibacterium sp.]
MKSGGDTGAPGAVSPRCACTYAVSTDDRCRPVEESSAAFRASFASVIGTKKKVEGVSFGMVKLEKKRNPYRYHGNK